MLFRSGVEGAAVDGGAETAPTGASTAMRAGSISTVRRKGFAAAGAWVLEAVDSPEEEMTEGSSGVRKEDAVNPFL